MRRFVKFLHSLANDVRGASIVFVAAAIIPLVAFVGVGTDAARGYLLKARLSQALDAAGLAGAQNAYDSTKLSQDVSMFFAANMPPGFMDATLTGPTYSFDSANDKLTLNASAEIPTTFMRVLGFQTLKVSASTEITRKQIYMDIILGMDVSGSMGWSAGGGLTRIQATKNAANTLIQILFGSAETKPLLKIGLVPWNSKVNIGRQGLTYSSTTPLAVSTFKNPITGATGQTQVYMPNNSPVPLFSIPPANWKGCVYARYLNDGIGTNDGDVTLGPVGSPQGDWIAWEPIGQEGEPKSPGRCSSAPSGYECTPCPTVGITALQASKTTILARINELTPGGSTNIPQGLVWSWRVLAPDAPFQEADPNPPGERVQAVVLLTDGENHGWFGDAYKAIWGLATPMPEMDSRLLAVATNMRAAGIKVYVIQFANGGSALQTLLKQVATEPDAPYYHYAPGPAELTQVFTEIANHLSELRLSK